MNSLVIVLFLSGMVAMIMLRTLHKDIARYNQVDQVMVKSVLTLSSTGAVDTVVQNKSTDLFPCHQIRYKESILDYLVVATSMQDIYHKI